MIFLNLGLAIILMMEGIITTLNLMIYKDPYTTAALVVIAFVYGFIVSETRRWFCETRYLS